MKLWRQAPFFRQLNRFVIDLLLDIEFREDLEGETLFTGGLLPGFLELFLDLSLGRLGGLLFGGDRGFTGGGCLVVGAVLALRFNRHDYAFLHI